MFVPYVNTRDGVETLFLCCYIFLLSIFSDAGYRMEYTGIRRRPDTKIYRIGV